MIKRKIVSIIFVLLAFVLQTTVFQALALADVVPNLVLVVTVCYGYLRGRTSGLVTGFFCGLMFDFVYGSIAGIYAFAFMTIGFLVGYCRKIYFTGSLVLPTILIAGSNFLYGVYYFVMEFLMRGRLNFGFYFLHVILPELVYTTLVGVLLYRFIVLIENLITTRREEE